MLSVNISDCLLACPLADLPLDQSGDRFTEVSDDGHLLIHQRLLVLQCYLPLLPRFKSILECLDGKGRLFISVPPSKITKGGREGQTRRKGKVRAG